MSTGGPLYLVSDFNIEPLARLLENSVLTGTPVRTAAYGQVMAALAAGAPDPNATAVVWTLPHSTITAFARALTLQPVDPAEAIAETNAYADAIARFAAGVRAVLLPTWTLPPWQRCHGMLDLRPDIGVAHLLARMNLALAERLRDHPSVFLLDAQRWSGAAGARGWSAKLWYAAKTPFAPALLEQAAGDIAAALDGLQGRSRRLLIVDLDDVLWGGIVGETGWEGLNLGGHDHAGEAFADFQRALKNLTNRGVQLAIVSRNDEATALEAIDRHPEMILRRRDFAAWRIGWDDKASSVASLLDELRLGAESAVFVDDSAIERARVAAAVPGVLVPEWPADPARYTETLLAMRCFDTPAITTEDRERSAMYTQERMRRTSAAAAGSLEEWLHSLEVTIAVEPLTAGNLERATQLFNKTNQMNAATRRLTKGELEAWARLPGHSLLTVRVADRFGDSGLSGIVGLAVEGLRATVTDFLVSCRVMGRGVEDAMLHVASAHARARGAAELSIELRPTPRNHPCLEFLRRSQLRATTDTTFVWALTDTYPRPAWVAVQDGARIAAGADR